MSVCQRQSNRETELKQLKCPNCGGNINRSRMLCEYCGTQFEEENNTLYVCSFTPHIDVLKGRVLLPSSMLNGLNSEENCKRAIDMLANSLADKIKPMMELRHVEHLDTLQHEIQCSLRVVRPDHRF